MINSEQSMGRETEDERAASEPGKGRKNSWEEHVEIDG